MLFLHRGFGVKRTPTKVGVGYQVDDLESWVKLLVLQAEKQLNQTLTHVDLKFSIDARVQFDKAYAFMDDGVYVLLSKHLTEFSARSVYVLAQHGHERGLTEDKNDQVQFIEMSDLVSLTALYPTSVSW